jgi:methionine-rich copper-binding protein CopC
MASAVAVTVLASTFVTHAQVRRRAEPSNEAATVPMQISLQAGGTAYVFTGAGRCRSTPRASIYDVPAAMWTVEQNAEGKSLTLTVWHPTGGAPDMLSLAVTAAGKSHRVDTVKIGQRGDVQGSGTVKLDTSAQGGVFTINAVAKDGEKISGTIKCDRFTSEEAAGG